MAIRVALNHRTSYRYDRLVNLSPQLVRLRPAPHCRTPIVSYSLRITPESHFINWQQDPHSNYLARLVFQKPTRELTVEVDLVAELSVIDPFNFFLETDAFHYPLRYSTEQEAELRPHLAALPVGPKFAEFLRNVPRVQKETVLFLVDLNRYVQQAVRYLIRLEPGVQTPEETLQNASGSCRDSAWLMVQLLRNLGLAARFVSGYLIQLRPDVKPLEGPAGTEQDFTDLHAWTEVYLPGAGWVGLDPTSGLFTGEGHLPLAATPEPQAAAPISGGVDECQTKFDVQMTVQRIHEDPRVTYPYSDETWQVIDELGHKIDAEFEASDVRLTMGGEPTFVSLDDMEGAEWNTAALGPKKRLLAGELFRRLSAKFAHGPLLHFGQGKWYPGESLPRWALGCYWRSDGESIWHDPRLIAEDDADKGHGKAEARDFLQHLALQLQVDPEHVIAGYEDTWYYLWKERRLPVNVDPLKSNLSDPEERARLARIFEQDLRHIVGYALPLRVEEGNGGETTWQSRRWFFRQEQMFLVPGDSPMGYRLPLDSIPWMAKKDLPQPEVLDPFAPRGELPAFRSSGTTARLAPLIPQQAPANFRDVERKLQLVGVASGDRGGGFESPWDEASDAPVSEEKAPPRLGESATDTVRTALCVEARGGVVHIFMPPVARLEQYLALVAAIERTAAELAIPVRIEGYLPPHDHRLEHVKVTPDPGVIEVNLPPARTWPQLTWLVTTLYDEARQCRLGTEKFMVDGRHTGTGGGNHIVIGGPTPADSPLLRRPDLLRSLIAYWNNRPSLSYLFSGLFIGPTSQAPRADEARHENIYELETALAQIPLDKPCPPWLVDRVLRHLLVDVTGNTHRAEFCIDKLYSPDSATGRLGLVEFRGFEMPPHSRMSLVQQLLIRALIARFWKTPYDRPLVRWGTSLHDRFMLPHFVAQDFGEVLDELTEAGYPLLSNWFATHFEFRFPVVGQVAHSGVQLELRQAIEPWHVLGEESGGGGTARYVDSSVERLQVKVRGLTESRFVLACNGRRVPLQSTGVQGEYVAGVRFRAWQPPSCLHPTIGVHAPLTFDLLDTWSLRSLGGCQWHVAHPGGKSHEDFPVNANAAESRRSARFFAIGHTGGKVIIPPEEQHRDYPLTLDLRRPAEFASLDA
jgi:uncharacterized protein (DUF2126 family)/transglutaminase-like putative cysteine protease